MAVCDKWVALKILEFFFCVACLVTKRVSQDDEMRLSLLLQKLSREWSLLTSVTWDSVGGAFADAVYGGYVIITFGLLLARVFQEIPRGRRILEGYFLGFGMLFFIILGGLELASLDSVPYKLVVNASVLGALSLFVAALFLVDLMGPRVYTTTHYSQTELPSILTLSPKSEKKVSIATTQVQSGNGPLSNEYKNLKNESNKNGIKPERPKDLDLEKGKTETKMPKSQDVVDSVTNKKESSLFDSPRREYTKFDDDLPIDELEKSKYGSVRTGLNFEGGNYIRLSDPLSELHYEQELAKFNENYYKKYLETVEGKYSVKEDYLPELQSPIFAKVKAGRLSFYDNLTPTYDQKQQNKNKAKTVSAPTLQQLEDYLKGSGRTRRGDTPVLFPMEPIEEKDSTDAEGRASGTPTDPGYVHYAADKWPEKRDLRTPRHSPQ